MMNWKLIKEKKAKDCTLTLESKLTYWPIYKEYRIGTRHNTEVKFERFYTEEEAKRVFEDKA